MRANFFKSFYIWFITFENKQSSFYAELSSFSKSSTASGSIEKVMIADPLTNNVLSISAARAKSLAPCLRFCMVGVGPLEEFGGYNLFYARCDIASD